VRVAVTGAGGLLAHELLPALRAAGHEVLALSHAEADVTQIGALRAAIPPFRPDWIFHLAAFTNVDACEAREEHALQVNGLGSRNVAVAAVECDAALLAISTDYVFDGTAARPYREYDPAHPVNAYGRSKWAGEQAIREISARHLIVRTSWLFGRGGPNFVDAILARARTGEPLAVVDDQRGSPTWTRDFSSQLLRLAGRADSGTCHCTGSGDATWHELAVHALAAAGIPAHVERTSSARLGRPAPRPAYSVLDNTWCEQSTGATMPHWKDAVSRYVHEGSAGGAAVAGRGREER